MVQPENEQKKAGKKYAERLKFLVVFTRELGMTDKDVAEKAGCAKNSIQYMWSVDDAMVDRIFTIVENSGYKIKFSLENQGYTKQGPAFLKIKRKEKSEGESAPARLDFLRIAMKKTGLTTREIASRLDLSENSIFYYFREDNTSMKFIYQFAEEFGYELKIDVTENA